MCEREAVERRLANIFKEKIEGYTERDYIMLHAREVHETLSSCVGG